MLLTAHQACQSAAELTCSSYLPTATALQRELFGWRTIPGCHVARERDAQSTLQNMPDTSLVQGPSSWRAHMACSPDGRQVAILREFATDLADDTNTEECRLHVLLLSLPSLRCTDMWAGPVLRQVQRFWWCAPQSFAACTPAAPCS